VESVFSKATTPPPRLFCEPRSPAPLKGRINIRIASSNYQNFVFNYPLNYNLTVFNNRNKEIYRNNISFFTVYKPKYIFIVQNEQNKIHL